MANNNPLQYVSVDYAAQRDALLQRIKARWSQSWNDFLNPNSLGRIFVDIAAYSFSNLVYLVNRAAAENFLSTMTLRESAVRLGQLVSYKLQSPSAASVLCEAQLAGPVSDTVTLSKGTAITVNNGGTSVVFELAASYTIIPGFTSPSTLILTVDPSFLAVNVLSTYFSAVNGSPWLDLNDTSIDLSALVSPGMTVSSRGSSESHIIASIEAAPGSNQKNRLVLDTPWQGPTSQVAADISDNRVAFTQGQANADTFTASNASASNQTFALSAQPVVQNSVSVKVAGSPWSVVPALALQDGSAQVVELRVLSGGVTALVFGDGVFGAIPADSAQIQVSYRVGGGVAGNVGPGTINATIAGTLSSGGQAQVQITNAWGAGQGGLDQETLDTARRNIPAFVRANNRGVTLGDYESLVTGFNFTGGQISFARAVAGSGNSLLEGNVVKIYAWTAGPTGGLVPISATLKNAARDFLSAKAVGTDFVQFLDGEQSPAQIALRFLTTQGYDTSEVAATVLQALQKDIGALTPGSPLIFSDLVNTVSHVAGVSSVFFASPNTDLSPETETTVLTAPDSSFSYKVELQFASNYSYAGHVGFKPVSPWALSMQVGGNPVLLLPDATPGIIRIVGNRTTNGLAEYNFGPLAGRPSNAQNGDYYYAADRGQLYLATQAKVNSAALSWVAVQDGGSYIDCATGRLMLSFTGAVQSVTYTTPVVIGYANERPINLFIRYAGDDSLATRQKIRANLRAWAAGLSPGSTVYSSAVLGATGQVLLSASRANVSDVVLATAGVLGVTQVALDSPSNSGTSVSISTTELPTLGSISINGYSD